MLRLLFSFIVTGLFSYVAIAQDLVEFTLGSGYQYDIYYSLAEGVTAYPERTDWELSFSISQIS